MGSVKRKLNLTIDETILAKAKQVAEARGGSLSSIVEDFLARLVRESSPGEDDWLSCFHQRYSPREEPSDEVIASLVKERG
jgi:hypothetical protein